LSVSRETVDIGPSAPKQRQLLALLLLNANRPVSVEKLVTELWDYVPPSTAVAAVHTYVMHLRKAMFRGAPGRIDTLDQGYRIRVQENELDLHTFTELVAEARMSLADGEYKTAARQLHGALDMWRGRILVDVTAGPLLRDAINRAERDHLNAISCRVDAELHLGMHHELVSELSGLVHNSPTHEKLTAQLILALYRSGRQVDALRTFDDLRRLLARDYRTAPSTTLRQLHQDILTGHPRLEVATTGYGRLSLDLGAADVSRRAATERTPSVFCG
jgi:DNA-binding SARP family transcriptional activator